MSKLYDILDSIRAEDCTFDNLMKRDVANYTSYWAVDHYLQILVTMNYVRQFKNGKYHCTAAGCEILKQKGYTCG